MSRKNIPIKQKSPDFSVETASPILYPLFIKRWFPPFGFHSHCLTNRFVCNFLSSSASFNLSRSFFWLTLAFWLSLSGFSGLNFFPLSLLSVDFLTPAVFAFFRPRQFWVLTTQPLFLPFPFLPVSASQRLLQCTVSAFASYVFPVFSCLVSRAFLPGFGTQPRCMFPFALP